MTLALFYIQLVKPKAKAFSPKKFSLFIRAKTSPKVLALMFSSQYIGLGHIKKQYAVFLSAVGNIYEVMKGIYFISFNFLYVSLI